MLEGETFLPAAYHSKISHALPVSGWVGGLTLQLQVLFPEADFRLYERAVELAQEADEYQLIEQDEGVWHLAIFSAERVSTFLKLRKLLADCPEARFTLAGGKALPPTFGPVIACFLNSRSAKDSRRYCNGGEREYRFGCRHVQLDDPQSSPRWYDFGSFDEQGRFQIDKSAILSAVHSLLAAQGRDFCPALDWGLVEDCVKQLPDYLVPENDSKWKLRRVAGVDVGVERQQTCQPQEPARPPEDANSTVVERLQQGKEDITKINPAKRGNTSYADIGGLATEVNQVRELVEVPLKYPELVEHLGIEMPKGILLFGPPGTGKTLIARALASETGATFFSVRGPELLSKWHGQTEYNLRHLFDQAISQAPAIIFFDEIDSFAFSRDQASQTYEASVVAQLLALMDGFEKLERVVIIAATNRPKLLDPALLRPGRFDRIIPIGMPDVAARREILTIHTRSKPLGKDVSLDRLAEATPGYTGADLAALCNEAALNSVRRVLGVDMNGWPPKLSNQDLKRFIITGDDFRQALDEVGSTQWEEDDWGKGLRDSRMMQKVGKTG